MVIQLKDYEVYADTSSLLDGKGDVFWGRILPRYLIEKGMRIIIPHCIINDLKRIRKGANPSQSRIAEKTLTTLEYLWNNGLAHVPEEGGNERIDAYIKNRFSQFRATKNLCLITHDSAFAQSIIRLKKSTSRNTTKELKVVHFKDNPTGRIEDDLEDWETIGNISIPTTNSKIKPFSLYTAPIVTKDSLLSVSSIPTTGHEVLSRNNGKIRLLKSIASGGEGIVYKANNGSACKIYMQKRLTKNRLRKLEVMTANPLQCPGICWPDDILRNPKGEFVGYTMPIANGAPLYHTVFGRKEIETCFPRWKKTEVANCVVTLLEKFVYLHQMNVIMGDINPFNILVMNEQDAYFVDTDSYQIEQYPCPVYRNEFTAPEIQEKDFTTFLRTYDHENFALAVLIFMILFYGKHPYAKIGGGTTPENIRQMDFPYPLDQRNRQKVPLGPWYDVWCGLTFKLRDAFYDVFKNNKRKSSSEWLQIMKDYKRSLLIGHASNELFPNGHRQQNANKVTCSSCLINFNEGEGYVVKTKQGGIVVLCPVCGQNVKKNKSLQFFASKQNQASQGQRRKNIPSIKGRTSDLLKGFFNP